MIDRFLRNKATLPVDITEVNDLAYDLLTLGGIQRSPQNDRLRWVESKSEAHVGAMPTDENHLII